LAIDAGKHHCCFRKKGIQSFFSRIGGVLPIILIPTSCQNKLTWVFLSETHKTLQHVVIACGPHQIGLLTIDAKNIKMAMAIDKTRINRSPLKIESLLRLIRIPYLLIGANGYEFTFFDRYRLRLAHILVYGVYVRTH